MGLKVREWVCPSCEALEVKILKGCVVRLEHVPICVSAPPTRAPSEIMRRIKGREVRQNCLRVFLSLKGGTGVDIFGPEDMSA